MDPYTGEIRIVGFPFAPIGWALCDGTVLPIAQYTPLFAVIGANFGGDGKNTFALPNLQGRVPLHWGDNPSLTPRHLGETGGAQTATVTSLPHTHQAYGVVTLGNATSPAGAVWGTLAGRAPTSCYSDLGPNVIMSPVTIDPTSSSTGLVAHNNMQPYLALYFIICCDGIFPSAG